MNQALPRWRSSAREGTRRNDWYVHPVFCWPNIPVWHKGYPGLTKNAVPKIWIGLGLEQPLIKLMEKRKPLTGAAVDYGTGALVIWDVTC